ncbi:MAG TPA: trehalose-phosphatase [Mycobacteriales bacterium]|jgi:trehalose 6-phosphate phosphatase|nr:trehalose-phosphatase [Mycobacteriales bacterium]
MPGDEVLAALLQDPSGGLVAVDFDGTLSPIVARPEDARPVAGAVEALESLSRRLGGVAIVSGRPAEEVVRVARLSADSGVQVFGHYGLQRWRRGALASPEPEPGVAVARARLADILEGADSGVRVEDKHHSLAVHTRGASHPGQELEALEPALESLADAVGLEAVPGRYVIELRPRGTDKGAALRTLVEQTAARVVIYLGDDLGDLPAFAAVEALAASGTVAGLKVAVVDPSDDDLPEAVGARADVVLDGPVAAVAWLSGIAEMLS